jgi:hypothetical protein
MQTPPLLTDRAALIRNRARIRDESLFLRRAIRNEVQDRLIEVNRSFTAAALITAQPSLWTDALPGAVVVPDDDLLALQPGAHDLVIHDMALHWANDPVGQLVQARLALRPDGMLIATLFGGQTLHELRACLAEAEAATRGGLSPRVAPMGEIRDLGALLQRAGFALPVADLVPFRVSYATALALMVDLRGMGESNALAARPRQMTPRRLIAETTARYAAAFGDANGRIPATFEVVTLTAWAPAPDQPQPLRPGSARARLADALRVSEQPLDPDRD